MAKFYFFPLLFLLFERTGDELERHDVGVCCRDAAVYPEGDVSVVRVVGPLIPDVLGAGLAKRPGAFLE